MLKLFMTTVMFATFVVVSLATMAGAIDSSSMETTRQNHDLLTSSKAELLATLSDRGLWESAQYDPEKWLVLFAAIHLAGRASLTSAIPVLEKIDEELCSPPSAERANFGQAVWLEVVPALVRLGQDEHIPLIVTYMSIETGFNRIVAARRTLEFQKSAAIPLLQQGVRGQTLKEVLYSVEALASVQDPYARGYLAEVMTQPDQGIRVQCALTAARYGWDDWEQELQDAFSLARGDTKFMAAEGLAWLGHRKAIDYLKSMLHGFDEFERHAAVGILGDICYPNVRPELESIAVDRRVPLMTRTYAVRALGNIGSPESLRVLAKLASEDNRLVRLSSCAAIIQVSEGIKIPMESAYLRFDLGYLD